MTNIIKDSMNATMTETPLTYVEAMKLQLAGTPWLSLQNSCQADAERYVLESCNGKTVRVVHYFSPRF